MYCMKTTRSAPKISAESVFSKLDDTEKSRFLALKGALEGIRSGLSSRSRRNRYAVAERIGRAARTGRDEKKPGSDRYTGVSRYS
jgi:hypothetical protein